MSTIASLTPEQLRSYFGDVCPEYVPHVVEILADYAGREAELVADLSAKYNVSPLMPRYQQPAPPQTPATASSVQDAELVGMGGGKI